LRTLTLLNQDFKELLSGFIDSEIDFLLVGATIKGSFCYLKELCVTLIKTSSIDLCFLNISLEESVDGGSLA
jgi:hypothetical protein